MHTNRKSFWPWLTLVALVLCAWLALTRGGTETRADNGGATTAGMIALMGTMPLDEHLYLIDTNTKRIMLYQAKPNDGFTFVAARSYDVDSAFLDKQDGGFLKYAGGGHDADIANVVGPLLKKKSGKP